MSIIKSNGAGESGGFYNGAVSTSLRFDRASAHYLSRDQGSAGNQKVFTLAFWVKRGIISVADTALFGTQSDGNNRVYMRWEADDTFKVYFAIAGTGYDSGTTMKFRDTSAWYHVAVVVNMAGSGDTGKLKIYVNGVNQTVTYASTLPDANIAMCAGVAETLGKKDGASNYMDGYLADVYLIDGTAVGETSGYLDEFGEVKEGIWIPKKYTGSYGTNGFHLEFTSSAHDAPASEGDADTDNIGADSSGQNHHWTAVDSISADDCAMPDCPENNFATWSPLFTGGEQSNNTTGVTNTQGNLTISLPTNEYVGSTFRPISGKWYVEIRAKTVGSANGEIDWGWIQATTYAGTTGHGAQANKWGGYYHAYSTDHIKVYDETSQLGSNINLTIAAGAVLQLAWDIDNNKGWIGINDTYYAADNGTDGNPSAGTNQTFTFTDEEAQNLQVYVANGTGTDVHVANFGQDSTFGGDETATTNADANGIGAFHHAPPTGFLACCSSNLPDVTIGPNSTTQADDYFTPYIWTGNGSNPRAFTDVGFQADWIWIKKRSGSGTSHHLLADSSRGDGKTMLGNETNAEATNDINGTVSDTTTSGGFTVNAGSTSAEMVNDNNDTYVAWLWKMNGGTTTAFTESGNNPGGTHQANTTAGQSIVTYTGTGSAGTVSHGLGAVPDWILIKNRDAARNWIIYHGENTSAPETDFLILNTTAATADNDVMFNDTAPTSSVFTVNTNDGVNTDGEKYVAYCFVEIEGYSKFGSYTGNGNNDGTFVFLGFRPSFIMTKRTNSTSNWIIQDSVRQTFNPSDAWLRPNTNDAEGTTSPDLDLDFVSNGFKIRNNGTDNNIAGSTYIYMAFAEAPFKYANAR
jgi:hypothetical protein